MALTFNGSNAGLTRVGQLVTGYPFTLFAWTRATNRQVGFAVALAVEPGVYGGYDGQGMLSDGSRMRAWSTTGSSVSAYSSRSVSLNDWVPCMVVYTAPNLRKVYYGTGAVQVETTNVPASAATLNTFCIGKQPLRASAYFAGDLASVGVWQAELSQTDFNALTAGAVPSTVQSGALVDYWSLLTQASNQVGVNGRSLGAANTTQAATHPITEAGGGADTTAPVLAGAITVSNLVSTGYTLAWPAGTDNDTVAGYERSLDAGATWTNVGNVLTVAIAGRTPGTTDQVQVRARDAAGNVSTPPLSTAVVLPAAVDATAPVLVGAITVSSLVSTGYALGWPAATDNVGVVAYDLSLDSGTTWANLGNVLAATVTGRNPGATDVVWVRARDAAGNVSTPVLSTSVLLPGGADVTLPVLTGSIGVAGVSSSGYTLSWPAATDNVGVTAYERSLDGGTTWLSVGNTLGVVVTGRSAGTTDQVRVRARDAAGNASTPPLAASVTLLSTGAGAFATPPLKNNTGTVLSGVTGITVNVYNAATGALVVRKSGLTSNGAGVVSVSDALLVPGTAYAYEVVTTGLGRRLPVASAA
jgi:hypothetical protein